ncbi:MAG: aminotransferase class V-fold PLP-dependent enzyme [Saprospiraceae bacterium]
MSHVVDAPKATTHTSLEDFFESFRQNTIGQDLHIDTPHGNLPMVYADWIASGRLYKPIEDKISSVIGPYMANTHTESNSTGRVMTEAYHQARDLIKKHVGAHNEDVLISSGSGMTSVINKIQRILGLRAHERYHASVRPKTKEETPIVFLTHMEHHSNQTSWLECLVDVEVIPADSQGLPDLDAYAKLLESHSDRPLKIAAVTSCSNVTGVVTPYREIARITHQHNGICFVDFAASAPYIDIEMRPKNDPDGHLDAIFFSPHKFLGGPGGTGILVFCPKLYTNKIPDNPGGGTVDWTNPWGEHKYLDSIEAREDGGTPAILQTIKSALAIRLKDEMGTDRMHEREGQLIDRMWDRFKEIPNLRLLEPHLKNRIGAISFYIEELHFNLGVRLLNDRFGIQVRGGCHCAGTYGHYLLNVDRNTSKAITDDITAGKLSSKPGWIRLSIHPMMTDASVDFILNAIEKVALYHKRWATDYRYDISINDFVHVDEGPVELVTEWFK